jgi:2-polyprenyl-3-methyl-5-hydroxy-6-metoxy-1,4-benzoquinol methylase
MIQSPKYKMEKTFISYRNCPLCGSSELKPALSAKDHTTSGKTFAVWECGQCSLRFTQDAPDTSAIQEFYQSEDYISHTDTNKGFVNRLYHLVRRRTLQTKGRLLSWALGGLKKAKLLDIGAGTGAFVGYMHSRGWQVTGLEPDQQARSRAAKLHDIKLLPSEDLRQMAENSFDAITMWHVLEHVHELNPFIEQLKKLIRPEGRIFIAVPNYTSFDARTFKSHWAAYDVPRHLYHFSPQSMKRLLELHGLVLYGVRPMWFDSFYISLLSEKYAHARFGLVRGIFIGALSNLNAWFNKERCSSLVYVAGKYT